MEKPQTPIKSTTIEIASGAKDIYEGSKNTARFAGMVTGISFLGAIALAFTKICTEASLSVLKIASRAIKMEKETRKKVDATFNSYISFIDNLGGSGIKGTFDKFFGNDAIKATGTITGLRATSALPQSSAVSPKVSGEKSSVIVNKDTAVDEDVANIDNSAGLNNNGIDLGNDRPNTECKPTEASQLDGGTQINQQH